MLAKTDPRHKRCPFTDPKVIGKRPLACWLGLIAALGLAAIATYEPPAPPAAILDLSDRELLASLERAAAEQQGDLATLAPPEAVPSPDRTHRLAHDAANAVGISPTLFHALLLAENQGRLTPDVSRAGAIGPAQLMPATARELGVDPRDAVENVAGGALHLSRLSARFGDDTLALIAYNMGQGATNRWLRRGGHWGKLPRETRDYVGKVKVNAALLRRKETQVAGAM